MRVHIAEIFTRLRISLKTNVYISLFLRYIQNVYIRLNSEM